MFRRTFIQVTSAALASTAAFVRAGTKNKTLVTRVIPCDHNGKVRKELESFVYSVEVPSNTPEEMCWTIVGGALAEDGWVQITRKAPYLANINRYPNSSSMSRHYYYTLEIV